MDRADDSGTLLSPVSRNRVEHRIQWLCNRILASVTKPYPAPGFAFWTDVVKRCKSVTAAFAPPRQLPIAHGAPLQLLRRSPWRARPQIARLL